MAHRLIFVLILITIGLLAFREVGSPDIGFHLKAGESILSGEGFPDLDTFTYTLTDRPYIDTSWGFQVIVTLVERAAGPAGLVVLNILLLLSIFVTLHFTVRLERIYPTLYLVLLAIGIVACETRFKVRPEIFSLFFLAATLYLLRRYAAQKRTPLYLLPLLLLLWVNIHSLFILGLGAIALVWVGLLIKNKKPDRKLLLWGSSALAATLINPYGIKGVLHPVTLLMHFDTSGVFSRAITELASPFNFTYFSKLLFYPALPVWSFRLLVLISIFALLPLIRHRRFPDLLTWAAFLFLSAKMIRNTPLFIVAALPAIVSGLSAVRGESHLILRFEKQRKVILTLLALLLILLNLRVITDAYYLDTRRPDRFGAGFNRIMLPVDACDYVSNFGPEGALFNDIGFGGYLMWATDQPVFIDGRLEVVGESFYREYLKFIRSVSYRNLILKRYDIRWIIFPHAEQPELLLSFEGDPMWRRIYLDHLAVIYARRGKGKLYLVDPAGSDSPTDQQLDLTPESLPGIENVKRSSPLARYLQGFIKKQHFPREDYTLGFFYKVTGDLKSAEKYFARGIRRSEGRYWEFYYYLGDVLMARGEKELARRCYEIVIKEYPDHPDALEKLRSTI